MNTFTSQGASLFLPVACEWKERYERQGYDGLFDRRHQRPSPKRVPLEVVGQVLTLYREQYADFQYSALPREAAGPAWHPALLHLGQDRSADCGPGRLPRPPGLPWGQLHRILALEHERVVGNDNCVAFGKRRFQIPKATWRDSFAKCRVKVYEPLDGTLSIGHGPHTLGSYDADGCLLTPPAGEHRDARPS